MRKLFSSSVLRAIRWPALLLISTLSHAALLLVDKPEFEQIDSNLQSTSTLTVNLIELSAPEVEQPYPAASPPTPFRQQLTATRPETPPPPRQTNPVVEKAHGVPAQREPVATKESSSVPPSPISEQITASVESNTATDQTSTPDVPAPQRAKSAPVTPADKSVMQSETTTKLTKVVKPTAAGDAAINSIVAMTSDTTTTEKARASEPRTTDATPTDSADNKPGTAKLTESYESDPPTEEFDDEFDVESREHREVAYENIDENIDVASTPNAQPASDQHDLTPTTVAANPEPTSPSSIVDATMPATATPTPVLDSTPQPRVDESAIRQQIRAQFDHDLIYPPLAKKRGWEGNVDVMLRVSAAGDIEVLSLVQSSGFRVLDRYTQKALEHIRLDEQTLEDLNGGFHDLRIEVKYQLLSSRG